MVPISSESEFSGATKPVEHCKVCQHLDECIKKLEWIGEIKQMGLQVTAKCKKNSGDLLLSGSVLHRVGTATEKAEVSAFVLTLGRGRKFELDDQNCLCCQEH